MVTGDGEDATFERRTQRQVAPPERLVERGDQLAELRALWAGTLAAAPVAVAVVGPWGTGKTALLHAAARMARSAGATVVAAHAQRGQRRDRFGMARQVVHALFRELAGGTVPASAPAARQVLLAMSRPAATVAEVVDPVADVLLEQAVAPVVCFVDDADAADAESVATLHQLARRLGPGRATLVVGTSPRSPGAVLYEVDRLLADADVRVLAVGPLSRPAFDTELRARAAGPVDPRFADAVWRATGGRPLFLHHLLATLRDEGRPWDAATADRLDDVVVPGLARQVVARLAGVTIAATDLVQAAAVLGDGTELPLARQLAGIDQRGAERAVDEAIAVEVLLPAFPLRFTSPLVRAAVLHEIPTAHRSRLHARAAELMAERGAGRRTVCGHLLRTDASGDGAIAAALHDCARAAVAEGDVGWAYRCLERALREPPAPAHLAGVLLDLVAVEVRVRPGNALAHLQRAVRLGDGTGGDPGRLAAAAAAVLRRLPAGGLHDAAVLDRLHDVLRRLPEAAVELRLDLLVALGHVEGGWSADDAAAMERLVAAGPVGSAAVRHARAWVALQRLRGAPPPAAAVLADQLDAVFDPSEILGPDRVGAGAQLDSAVGLLCCGRFGVDQALRAAAAATDAGDRATARDVQAVLALSALWQGALDEALTLAGAVAGASEGESGGESESGGSESGGGASDGEGGGSESGGGACGIGGASGIGDGWAVPLARACRAAALLDKGDVAGAMTAVPPLPVGGAAELSGAPGGRQPGLAEHVAALLTAGTWAGIRLAAGHAAEAAELAMAVAGGAAATGLRVPSLATWRAVAVEAATALGDDAGADGAAATWLVEARRFDEPRSLGAALRGSAALVRGSQRLALLMESRDVLAPSPARLEQARTELALGHGLIGQGRQEEGRASLRQAAHLASLCGADGLLEVAAQELRSNGCRPRRMAMTGWEALTPAEVRAAVMAAEGATNAAIAAALYVNAKTVEGHLARVYRKLGISSRRELPPIVAVHGDGRRPGVPGSAGGGPTAPGVAGHAVGDRAVDQVGPQVVHGRRQ